MTVTLGSKTLNLLGLREISEVKAVKTDRWENGGYKRRYSPIGLLRKWRLECIEKNVAWNESAIKYLQEQAAQATKLDFTADLGVLYNVNTQVQVLGCRQRFNPLGEANIRRFTVTLMEAQPFTISPDRSCVLYLPLDEGSGTTAYDRSGQGNNGTIYGATWVDGKYGKALNFDGDDYTTVSNNANLQITGDLTVAIWFYPRAYGGILVEKHWNYEFMIRVYTNGGIRYAHGDGVVPNVIIDLLPANSVSLNSWHHLVVVRNGTARTVQAFLDGVAGDIYIYTKDPVSSTRNIFIGSESGGSNFFNGIIDEICIYNRALSADEIRQLYLSGAVRVGAETLMPTDVGESFELAGGEWDAYQNESYIRKLAVLGQKRTWRITFIEKNVPWSYSAAKYLQYKAWKGEPVYFKARLGSRYETEEVEAYITGLELNLPSIADKNIRHITVTLREA